MSVDAQIVTNLSALQDSVEIGDTIDLIYDLRFPRALTLREIDYMVFDSIEKIDPTTGRVDTIPDYVEFEWLRPDPDYGSKVLQISQNDLIQTQRESRFRDTISLIAWDFGLLIFQYPKMKFDSSALYREPIQTQPPVVLAKVPKMLMQSDSVSLLPIKPIIKEEKKLEDYYLMIFLLGALLLGGLLAFLYMRRNRKQEVQVEKVVIKRPAHVIALEKLSGLRQEAFWKKGNVKKHQSELTYIIREYLEERFGIKALESTTDEIVYALKNKDFQSDHENNLKEILQIADLVKFAKAEPPLDINETFVTKAESFVHETKRNIVESNNPDAE